MTNKQTLPEGICILKEELINPNEPLIGGVCGGDISEHWGFLLSLRCLVILFLAVDDQLFWHQKDVVEYSHIMLVCPMCSLWSSHSQDKGERKGQNHTAKSSQINPRTRVEGGLVPPVPLLTTKAPTQTSLFEVTQIGTWVPFSSLGISLFSISPYP